MLLTLKLKTELIRLLTIQLHSYQHSKKHPLFVIINTRPPKVMAGTYTLCMCTLAYSY